MPIFWFVADNEDFLDEFFCELLNARAAVRHENCNKSTLTWNTVVFVQTKAIYNTIHLAVFCNPSLITFHCEPPCFAIPWRSIVPSSYNRHTPHTWIYSTHAKLLAFQRDCLCSREPQWSKSVFMARDSIDVFSFFLLEAALIGIAIPFDVMSCNGISRGVGWGGMFLCRRQPRQASSDKGSSNQIRHIIKSSERPELARSTG